MKLPKGFGKPVLYLDYDGVLSHDNVLWHPRRGAYLQAPPGHTLFQHAPLLEEVLAPYPDIRIVLSTSWVLRYGCAGAAKRLPTSLRGRVIGATYHSQMWADQFRALPRWKQVWDDVLRRRPGSWLAVDNDVQDWPETLRRHLVATDDVHGISVPRVRKELRERLALLASGNLPVP
jgi:hypothetical protein